MERIPSHARQGFRAYRELDPTGLPCGFFLLFGYRGFALASQCERSAHVATDNLPLGQYSGAASSATTRAPEPLFLAQPLSLARSITAPMLNHTRHVVRWREGECSGGIYGSTWK